MEDKKFYSVEECATAWGCSYHTAYNYVTEGKVRAIKMGHFWRVPAEEVKYVLKYGTRKTRVNNK